MAPPKVGTQKIRNAACERLLGLLSAKDLPGFDENTLQSLSTVKGLFNRIAREDQWDWFTVSGQLGHPSQRLSNLIAIQIGLFRSAIKVQDRLGFAQAGIHLRRMPTRKCLSAFLGEVNVCDEPGAGWIYVLSTREFPDLLKIGMTTRDVAQRAIEINKATGVAVPFGVRRCWRVSDPSKAERAVHQCLQRFRLRKDREFFRVPFRDAAKLIGTVVRDGCFELRTVDAPGALSPRHTPV